MTQAYVTQKGHHVSSVLIYVSKMIEISKKRHLIEEACKKFPGQAPINTYQHVTHAKILKPKKIIPQNMLRYSDRVQDFHRLVYFCTTTKK